MTPSKCVLVGTTRGKLICEGAVSGALRLEWGWLTSLRAAGRVCACVRECECERMREREVAAGHWQRTGPGVSG